MTPASAPSWRAEELDELAAARLGSKPASRLFSQMSKKIQQQSNQECRRLTDARRDGDVMMFEQSKREVNKHEEQKGVNPHEDV